MIYKEFNDYSIQDLCLNWSAFYLSSLLEVEDGGFLPFISSQHLSSYL